MKVLVVTPIIRPGGGPAGYAYNMILGIDELGSRASHTYSFAGRQSHERRSLLRIGGQNSGAIITALHRVNRATRGGVRSSRDLLASAARSGRRLRQRIREHDVVIFHGFQPSPQVSYAKRAGKLVMYMPHSPTPTAHERAMLAESAGTPMADWDRRQLLAIEAKIVALSDCVVFPSEGAMAEYSREFGDLLESTHVEFVRSGVPPAAPAREERTASPEIMFVGRYVAHKGYDMFCQAAATAMPTLPNHSFVSLGTGPLTPSSPVIDLGWSSDPHPRMRQASFVCISNRVAYYDLLPLECAALGLPLVMTPVGGNVDQASLLPDTILAESASAEALATAMRRAAELAASNPTWGTRNLAAYRELFTPLAMAQQWDAAITNLIRE